MLDADTQNPSFVAVKDCQFQVTPRENRAEFRDTSEMRDDKATNRVVVAVPIFGQTVVKLFHQVINVDPGIEFVDCWRNPLNRIRF